MLATKNNSQPAIEPDTISPKTIKTILVIGETRLLRDALIRILINHEKQTHRVANFSEALKWLQKHTTDAVFWEFNPQQPYELSDIAYFNEFLQHKKIPCAAYSNDSSMATQATALDSGVDVYLCKPNTSDGVEYAIEALESTYRQKYFELTNQPAQEQPAQEQPAHEKPQQSNSTDAQSTDAHNENNTIFSQSKNARSSVLGYRIRQLAKVVKQERKNSNEKHELMLQKIRFLERSMIQKPQSNYSPYKEDEQTQSRLKLLTWVSTLAIITALISLIITILVVTGSMPVGY